MKEIMIYQSDDGATFGDMQSCQHYEKIAVSLLMSMHGRIVGRKIIEKHSNRAVRQDLAKVKEFRQIFYEACATLIPSSSEWFEEVKSGKRHPSHASRILSDYASQYPMLNKCDFYLSCINMESGILYPQPYYATHEEEFLEDGYGEIVSAGW